MGFNMINRTPEEISLLGRECLEHEKNGSHQFDKLSYEQGIRAALRWLLFSTADYPLDIQEPREVLPEVVHSEVKLD